MKEPIEPRVAITMLASIHRCLNDEIRDRSRAGHTGISEYYSDPGRMALIAQFATLLQSSGIQTKDPNLIKLLKDPEVGQLFDCIPDYAARAYEHLMLLDVFTTEGLLDCVKDIHAESSTAGPAGQLADRIMSHLQDCRELMHHARSLDRKSTRLNSSHT